MVWNPPYFAPDVPDITHAYQMARSVTITVHSPSGSLLATLKESYAPDSDGNITIRDLGTLAMAYLEPYAFTVQPKTAATLTPYVTITVTVSSAGGRDSVTYTSRVYYSRSRTGIDSPEAYDGFLTRYISRTVTPATPLCICHRATLSVTLGVSHTYTEAETGEQRVGYREVALHTGSGDATTVATHCIDAAAIAAMVNTQHSLSLTADDILRVEALLTKAGEVTDSIDFHIDHYNCQNEEILLFTNCFGMPEAEPMTGTGTLGIGMDSDTCYMDNRLRKAWTEMEDTRKVVSGYMSRERVKSLRDLAESPRVMLLKDGKLEEVTVTGIDLSDEWPRTTANAATITYRTAHRHQDIYDRTPVTPPDRTFDDSFTIPFE